MFITIPEREFNPELPLRDYLQDTKSGILLQFSGVSDKAFIIIPIELKGELSEQGEWLEKRIVDLDRYFKVDISNKEGSEKLNHNLTEVTLNHNAKSRVLLDEETNTYNVINDNYSFSLGFSSRLVIGWGGL